MRPQVDPARRCLPVAEWPEADRLAWYTAFATDDPLSVQRSTAASWKAATGHKNRRGYGRWLTFLKNSGAELAMSLPDRVTPDRISSYLGELRRQEVSPYTLRNRIMELLAVVLALAPGRDWSWLKTCVVHLDRRAEDFADRSLPPVLTADVLEPCMKELRRRMQARASRHEAIEYRNWLMLIMMATLPMRLRNFTALSLTRHLERRGGVWWIDIDGSETKTGRPYAAVLPSDVGKFLEHYLLHIRPLLDRGAGGGAVWLGIAGTPLAEHTIYILITELSRRAFGIPLNPHAFRRVFATSVSIADPEAIEGARAVLGHTTRKTTQSHYNRASTLTAARRHAEIMRRLRAGVGPPRNYN